MKKALLIGGAVALALIAVRTISGARAYTPAPTNAPTNYLDSYWSNLKQTVGSLF